MLIELLLIFWKKNVKEISISLYLSEIKIQNKFPESYYLNSFIIYCRMRIGLVICILFISGNFGIPTPKKRSKVKLPSVNLRFRDKVI